jgi:hypothetical protein
LGLWDMLSSQILREYTHLIATRRCGGFCESGVY